MKLITYERLTLISLIITVISILLTVYGAYHSEVLLNNHIEETETTNNTTYVTIQMKNNTNIINNSIYECNEVTIK